MAFIHGKDSAVLLNEHDLSAYFNTADVASSNDTAETTAFGDSAKTYLVGLNDATLSLSGMWDGGTDASDETLQGLLGASTTPLVTVNLGGAAIGNSAIVAKAHETSYAISNPVADVVTITADFNASTDNTSNVTYGVRNGVQMTAGASIAFGSLGNLGAVNNGASSANGGFGNLHVTANTLDAAVTIKIQESTDDATYADLITFSDVSAGTGTSEQKAVSGTVEQYLRVTASSSATSGAITFHVAFARF